MFLYFLCFKGIMKKENLKDVGKQVQVLFKLNERRLTKGSFNNNDYNGSEN